MEGSTSERQATEAQRRHERRGRDPRRAYNQTECASFYGCEPPVKERAWGRGGIGAKLQLGWPVRCSTLPLHLPLRGVHLEEFVRTVTCRTEENQKGAFSAGLFEKMRTFDEVVTVYRFFSRRVTACLGTSHKSRLRRASLSRGDAVFRGVLRVRHVLTCHLFVCA